MFKHRKCHIVVAASIVLAACDGASSKSTSPQETLYKGTFSDSPVTGLYYETESQSGLTDQTGTFTYLEGETVHFFLGQTELGRAPGQAKLNPFDITGHRALNTETEILSSFRSVSANSYDKALNIATLVQLLDRDGNPDNGIDLADAHIALTEVNIPLFVKAIEFQNNEDLSSARKILGLSFVRDFQSIVDHLYQNLQIDISSPQVAKTISRNNTDLSQSFNYQYDSDGKLLSVLSDIDNDGNIDSEKSIEYNSEGLVSYIAKPVSLFEEFLNYDSDSNIISRVRTGNSITNTEERYSYTNGKLEKLEIDLNNDGSIDSATTLRYTDSGKLRNVSLDKDGDSAPETTTQLDYQNDLVKTYSEVSGNNSEPELLISYNYDSHGNKASQRVISTIDSSQKISRFTYDANGRPTRYELDKNQDGKPEYVEAYQYNQQGKRIEYKRDKQADGVWDFTAQYFYDLNGNRTRMVEDSDGNGIADKVWESEYQAAVLDSPWTRIIEKL